MPNHQHPSVAALKLGELVQCTKLVEKAERVLTTLLNEHGTFRIERTSCDQKHHGTKEVTAHVRKSRKGHLCITLVRDRHKLPIIVHCEKNTNYDKLRGAFRRVAESHSLPIAA